MRQRGSRKRGGGILKLASRRCVIKDLLGNSISEGSLVWWLSKALPLRVTKITPGGLSLADRGETTLARITLEISLPVQPLPGGEEPQFTDFLCTMNPDAERIIEGMMQARDGGRTQ